MASRPDCEFDVLANFKSLMTINALKVYQHKINELATEKQWGMDKAWLMLGCYKELGELIQAIEHDDEKTVVAKEFGDVMHYLLQLMTNICPDIDVDIALVDTMHDNALKTKKTYIDGNIQLR